METISQSLQMKMEENERLTLYVKIFRIIYLFLDLYINQSLFLVGYITRILSKNIHFHEKGSCHDAFVQGRR